MISTIYESPIGKLTLVSDGEALTHLDFETTKTPAPKAPRGSDKVLTLACKELDAYFAGKLKRFTTPVRPRRHGVSKTLLGGAPENSLRRDAQLWPTGDHHRQSQGHARRRSRQWQKPDRRHHPLPSRHRRRWRLDWLRGRLARKQFLLELEQGQQLLR